MRERGKPRASDEENRIIRVDRSFKKKDGRFPPPSDRRPTTRRRRSWEIGARSATSVVSSRSTRRADDRSIDPSIDRSIVGLGSRSPVLHHPSRRSVPTKRTRAHAPCFPWNRETNPRERQRCASPASSSETKRSVSHSVRPSVHPGRRRRISRRVSTSRPSSSVHVRESNRTRDRSSRTHRTGAARLVEAGNGGVGRLGGNVLGDHRRRRRRERVCRATPSVRPAGSVLASTRAYPEDERRTTSRERS